MRGSSATFPLSHIPRAVTCPCAVPLASLLFLPGVTALLQGLAELSLHFCLYFQLLLGGQCPLAALACSGCSSSCSSSLQLRMLVDLEMLDGKAALCLAT